MNEKDKKDLEISSLSLEFSKFNLDLKKLSHTHQTYCDNSLSTTNNFSTLDDNKENENLIYQNSDKENLFS